MRVEGEMGRMKGIGFGSWVVDVTREGVVEYGLGIEDACVSFWSSTIGAYV
jgi:hypothetical protein